MFLSIVTGSFQRLDYLRAMCESVRRQLPQGMEYEFVVVDGGSTDGTQAWCAAQPDVTLIEQGALYGAIRAFNAGAAAAHGEYVALLNDDVLVVDGAMIKALVYLDSHPDCGAVAFMDDRPAPGYEAPGYHVQTIRALKADGSPLDVVYAQCGLYCKWLGDLVGWWDIGVPEQHTYGGDAALSAKIWERGYRVDAVVGVAVNDRVARDDLRARNQQTEERIGSAFYRAYPNGVRLNSQPKPANPQPERLRILYAPLFSPGYGRYKRGLFDALARVGLVYELDYVRQRGKFLRAVADFQPHLILTQLHDAHSITAQMLEAARQSVPGAVIVNWCGDVYADQLTAPDMLELLKQIDLQLVVNADVLPVYAAHGIHAAYWQIGFEPVPDELPDMPAHEIVFQGNAYSPARKLLAAALYEMSGDVGIYGLGWDRSSGNTFYDFARSAALYRNCKIAVGDNQYSDKGFVSNRLFEAISNGTFLLHQTIPGLEELTGLIDGTHYISWLDLADLRDKARYYLAPEHEDERQQIAAAGEAFVRAHHSFDARVRELFQQLLPRVNQNERSTTPSGDAIGRETNVALEAENRDYAPKNDLSIGIS
jgi:spore maturation protein CgeB/glycosyltransferase involved in cell wall biosynthesis